MSIKTACYVAATASVLTGVLISVTPLRHFPGWSMLAMVLILAVVLFRGLMWPPQRFLDEPEQSTKNS